MQLTKEHILKKRDLILILVLLVVIAGGFLVKRVFFSDPGPVAIIRQPGGIITEVPLNKNQVFEVDDTLGGTNTIEVKDGTIAVIASNCDDHLCEWFGAISVTGDAIACLPHGLVISIGDPFDETFAIYE